MYIDEKLIKILEPHKGETIDVSCAISLIKTIAKEHEAEQCDIASVIVPNGTLLFHLKQLTKEIEDSHNYGFSDVLENYIKSNAL